MSSCEDCLMATQQAWHSFSANCPGCWARAVSRSPTYWQALEAGGFTAAYRALLQRAKVTHDAVKEAAGKDYMRREQE